MTWRDEQKHIGATDGLVQARAGKELRATTRQWWHQPVKAYSEAVRGQAILQHKANNKSNIYLPKQFTDRYYKKKHMNVD